jgi:hypothetical protein
MKSFGLPLALALVGLTVAAPAAAGDAGYRVVWDDFRAAWSADTRWFDLPFGPSYTADDGCAESTPFGLVVRSCGTNPWTGMPAFRNTLGQDSGALAPFDHAKWISVMSHFTSNGVLGFDAVPGQELACEATVSGRLFGVDQHPFGNAVVDPDADPRLASVAISAFDPETFAIFNFLLTNEMVFAFYERPAFARAPGANDAAFQFAVPVLRRQPHEAHRLKIAYDRAAGTVRWVVDGVEVFRIDAIGSRIDRDTMLIDHGGDDVILDPAQLDCAMAIFDFLDGYGPTHRGLVQIELDKRSYFNPRLGSPARIGFVDPHSRPESRLFGQGAEMHVERFVVSSVPVAEVDDGDGP